jgi:hypothetical protein
MTGMKRLAWLVAWAWLWSGSTRASSLTTYIFEGTVNSVNDINGAFDNTIQAGSPFTLKVSIPADTPNHLGSNAVGAQYSLPGSGMSLSTASRSRWVPLSRGWGAWA